MEAFFRHDILSILSKTQILFEGLYMCYLNSQFVYELSAYLSTYLDIDSVVHVYMELFLTMLGIFNICIWIYTQEIYTSIIFNRAGILGEL